MTICSSALHFLCSPSKKHILPSALHFLCSPSQNTYYLTFTFYQTAILIHTTAINMAAVYDDLLGLPKARRILNIVSYSAKPKILQLPGEIRNQIYQLALFEPDLVYRRHQPSCHRFGPETTYWPIPASAPPEPTTAEEIQEELTRKKLEQDCYKTCCARGGLGLLRTNKQIAGEAGSIFWHDSSFTFHSAARLLSVTKSLTQRTRFQIRSVKIVGGAPEEQHRSWVSEERAALRDALAILPNLDNLSVSPYLVAAGGPQSAWRGILRLRMLTICVFLELPLYPPESSTNPIVMINRNYDMPECRMDWAEESLVLKACPSLRIRRARVSLEADNLGDRADGLGKEMGELSLEWIRQNSPTHTRHNSLRFWIYPGDGVRQPVDLLGLQRRTEPPSVYRGPPAQRKQRKVVYEEELEPDDFSIHDKPIKTRRNHRGGTKCSINQRDRASRSLKVQSSKRKHGFTGPSSKTGTAAVSVQEQEHEPQQEPHQEQEPQQEQDQEHEQEHEEKATTHKTKNDTEK